MRVRQSTLNDADKCLRSMQYSIESNVYHAGSVRAVGTGYHYGLEFAYDNMQRHGGFPDIDVIVSEAQDDFDRTASMVPSHESELTKEAGTFAWDKNAPDFETAHSMIDVMLRAYFGDPEAPWPIGSQYEVLDTELGFALPLWGEQHTRNGSIDLVLQDADGWIIGEDHKTASKKWNFNKHHARKNGQAVWYTQALKEMFPGAAGYRFVFDIMTYKGVFERREVHMTDEHFVAVDAKAMQVVAMYEGMRAGGMDMPANPSSMLCSPLYCDHWDICPYGAALDVQ